MPNAPMFFARRLCHSGVTAALLLSTSIVVAAPQAAQEFRIMSDSEAAAYKAKMAELSGAARDDYRNLEYSKLKARAQSQGYLLPDMPPWSAQNNAPQAATSEKAPSDVKSLIEEHKATIDAAKAQANLPVSQPNTSTQSQPDKTQPATSDVTATATSTTPAVSSPAIKPLAETAVQAATASVRSLPPHMRTHQSASSRTMENYRQSMRNRFDRFMQERQNKQQSAPQASTQAAAPAPMPQPRYVQPQQAWYGNPHPAAPPAIPVPPTPPVPTYSYPAQPYWR